MSKLVVFNIGEGNFEQGFPVTLLIGEEGKLFYKDHQDRLPPAPELPNLYRQWQQRYYGLEPLRRVLKPAPNQITNFSIDDCKQAAKDLEDCVKEWFKQPSFLNLRSYVLDEVGKIESVRVIFQTQDELLRKLPWHLWDLFERRRNAEFSISARFAPQTPELKRPVKILAILGGNEGIDTTEDEKILKNLPGAKVTPLPKRTREEFNDNLWDQPWDILFFAGHSSTQEGGKSGVIQLNDTDSLSLSQLRNGLKKAIKNGLKLAIFNSCDGLGLANELADLQIPQVIVMREPVPDRVAQKFLRYFLEYFSTGEPFNLAVRQAREKLQGMEGEFPCASWLPVICQNPAEKPPIWPRSWLTILRTKIRLLWRSNKPVVLVGGAIASAIAVSIGSPKIYDFSKTRQTPVLISPVIANHISSGERILINNNTTNSDKVAGIQDFNTGNFLSAIKHFEASLKKNFNDPETLIYLNNARAKQDAKLGTKQKLEIAVSVPISSEPNVAEEILRGVAQAQSEINCGLPEISRAVDDAQSELNCRGGIDGKLLQVTIANDEDKPELAEKVADAFVKDRNISAVIGHYSSDATLQAGHVYEAKGLVVISPSSSSVSLSGFSNYVFRTVPSDKVTAENLGNYLKRLGLVKAAVAYDRKNTYSKSLKNEFQQQLPSGNFVFECDLSQGNFSAGDCVNQAQQKQAEVLLLAPGTKDTLDKAFLVIDSNNGKLRLLGGDALYNSRTLTNSGQEAIRSQMVIAVPWQRSPGSEFAQKADNFWKRAVNWRTATAYDATQAIVAGLRKIDGSPDRQQLRQVLSRPDFSAIGATGKVEFDQSGDRKRSTNVGVLVQVQPNPQPNPQLLYTFASLEQPQQ